MRNFPCPQLPDLTLYNALKQHKPILLTQTHITGDGYRLFLTTTTRYVAYFTFLNTIVYALDYDLQHRDRFICPTNLRIKILNLTFVIRIRFVIIWDSDIAIHTWKQNLLQNQKIMIKTFFCIKFVSWIDWKKNIPNPLNCKISLFSNEKVLKSPR